MSTTIDERVVEMKFDNKDFEKNVSTTMTTLDQLKKELDFKDAGKAFDDLGDAANRFSLSGMADAIDNVSGKFDVLKTVAFSVINRIVNEAISAGQRIEHALGTGLTGLSAGFAKYGDKNTAVGTLVSQGYDISLVNDQLAKLNWFTDETSYNFVDMVSNIGKFTAAGQGLEESVQAMMGIANWAAMSGQNATTASRAMYQLSQAMGRGVIRMEDWRSIQNANMDTVQFREQAAKAAVAVGKLKDNLDGTYDIVGTKYSGKSLTELFTSEGLTQGGWLTADAMMTVFSQYSSAVDELYAYSESRGITASQAIEEIGDSLDEFGLKAFKAAQEARNWADVTSSVADAVSTAWMKIFETIFGDYDEAKEVFTQMANDLYDIFAQPVNDINDILFDGLASGWKRLSKTSGVSLQQLKNQFTAYAKQYNVDLDSLIKEYGSFEKALKSGWVTSDILTSALQDLEDQLEGLSESELRAQGYTKQQFEMLKKLNEEFRTGKISVSEWASALSGMSGRDNLFQALWNIRDALFAVDEETEEGIGIIAVFRDAWAEVFPAPDGNRIRSITQAIQDFTEKLIPSEETAGKLRETFAGVISVFSIFKQVLSGVWDVLKSVLSVFRIGKLGILDFAASIGEMLKKFAESGKIGEFFQKIIAGIEPALTKVRAALSTTVGVAKKLLGRLWEDFKKNWPGIYQVLSDGFSKASTFIRNAIKELAPVFEPVRKAASDLFTQIWGWANGYLPDVGTIFQKLAPVIQAAFAKISEFAVKAWPVVKKVVSHIAKNLADLFTALYRLGEALWPILRDSLKSLGPWLSQLWEDFTSGLERSWPTIKEVFGKIWTFLEQIWSFANKTLENAIGMDIPEAFLNIGTAIGRVIDKLSTLLKGINTEEIDIPEWVSKTFGKIGEWIKLLPGMVESIWPNIQRVFQTFKLGTGTLSDLLSGLNIKENLSKTFEWLKSVLGIIVEALTGLDVGQIADAIENQDWDRLAKAINHVIDIIVSIEWFRILHGIADITSNAGGTFRAIKDAIRSWDRSMWIDNFKALALSFLMVGVGIALLIGSIKDIIDIVREGNYSWDEFKNAALIVGGVGLLIGAIVDTTAFGEHPVSFGQALSYITLIKGIEGLLDQVIDLIDTMDEKNIAYNEIEWATGIISHLAMVLGAVVEFAAFGQTKVTFGQAASYLTVMVSVKGLVSAAKEIAEAGDPIALQNAISNIESLMRILGAIVGGPGIVMSIAGLFSKTKLPTISFAGIGFAFLSIAAVLWILSKFVLPAVASLKSDEIDAISKTFGKISDFMGWMVILMTMLSYVSMTAGKGNMAMAMLALAEIAGVVWAISETLAAVMAAGVNAGQAAGILFSIAGTVLIMGALVAAIAIVAKGVGIASLAMGMAVIAVLAGAIWVIGQAIAAILSVGGSGAQVIGILMSMVLALFTMSLLIAAIGFLATAGLGVGMLEATVILLELANVVSIIGDAIAAVLQVGDADQAGKVANKMALFVLELAGIVTALGGLLTLGGPLAMVAGGAAALILASLADTVAVIAHALVDAGEGIKTISIYATPEALERVKKTGEALVSFGTDLGKLHLNGSEGVKDLAKISTPLTEILSAVSAFDAVLPADYFSNLAEDVIAFGAAVQDNSFTIVTAIETFTADIGRIINGIPGGFEASGVASVDGFVSGFNSRLEWAQGEVAAGMLSIKAAGDAALGIASPSKVFAAMGAYSMLGYTEGLEKESYTAVDAMKDTILQIADYLDENKEFDPVIRPVLDLSNVQQGAARIGGYFSASQAVGIAARMNNANAVNMTGSESEGYAPGATYSFVQNNYSPKALNRLEIYRQTRNQISAIEGAMRAV